MNKITTSHPATSPDEDMDIIKKLGELIDMSTRSLNNMKESHGEENQKYISRKDNHWIMSMAWIVLKTYNNDMKNINDLFDKYRVRDAGFDGDKAIQFVDELSKMLH